MTTLQLFVALLLPCMTAAQGVDAVVRGTVRDATGAVLPGAVITFANTETGLVRSATTDGDGVYRIAAVPPGLYQATAALAGFRSQVRARQPLHVGSTSTLDFTLDVVTAAGAVQVVARTPALETTKNSLSRLVNRAELDALPVVDRNFNALATLAPGVTATGTYGGVDIGGNRDFQNSYNVDGVSAEGIGAGDQRIRYAQDWMQEFQVLTMQYAAEFGGASGGILNAITRTGSNAAVARAYGFWRNGAWDATPAFATSKLPLTSKRLGGTASGKIIRDRLFYFGGFEWLDDETSRVVNSLFTELNGSVPATTDQKVYIGRLDYFDGGASTYRLRANGERRRATNVGVGGRVTEESGLAVRYGAQDVVAVWNRIISSSALNELRGAFSSTADNSQCNFAERHPEGPWFSLLYTRAQRGCAGGGFGRKQTNEIQLIENFSWTRGLHQVKAGVRVSRARSHGDYRFVRDGVYRFQGDAPFNPLVPSSYPVFFAQFVGATAWDYPRWAWGAFVQDSWRVTPDLTLNAGLRYDIDGTYTALNRLIKADTGLNTVRTDNDNLAPRAGIVWNVNKARTRQVRGGVGTYHDENHGNVATLLLFNSILVERAVFLNFQIPEPPFTDGPAVRRFLADALARNTVPDISALPAGVGAAPDLEPNLQVPFTLQASVGVAHQFGLGFEASADMVYARGIEQYTIRDVNVDRDAALGGNPGSIVRPNRNYSLINRYGDGGRFRYRALHVQAGFVAPGRPHLIRLAYTWSRNESNTRTALEGIGGASGATNPFDLDEDFGPTDHDIRHNVVMNWVAALPLDMQLSGILSARSALPWSVALQQGLDADPFPDRPEPRNSRRGDSFLSLDVRLAKTVRFGMRRSATALAEVFNATNATNHSGFINDPTSIEAFGQPTSALDRRRVQLGFRIDF